MELTKQSSSVRSEVLGELIQKQHPDVNKPLTSANSNTPSEVFIVCKYIILNHTLVDVALNQWILCSES